MSDNNQPLIVPLRDGRTITLPASEYGGWKLMTPTGPSIRVAKGEAKLFLAVRFGPDSAWLYAEVEDDAAAVGARLSDMAAEHTDALRTLGLLPPEPTPEPTLDVWVAVRRWMKSGGDLKSQIAVAHAGATDPTQGFVERSTHAANLLLLSAFGFHAGIQAYQRGDGFRDQMDGLLEKDKTRSWSGLFGDEHQVIIAAEGEWTRATTLEDRKAQVEEIMERIDTLHDLIVIMTVENGDGADIRAKKAELRAIVEKAIGATK